MPRGLVIFLSVCGLIAVLGIWGLPHFTHWLFGDTRQTKVTITMVEDDYEVEQYVGAKRVATVPRKVVGMIIEFPMGGAPENTGELQFKEEGREGRVVKVEWGALESKEDDPNKGVSRWVFKEVFFPIEFKQGGLWNQNRELAYIKLPPAPFYLR